MADQLPHPPAQQAAHRQRIRRLRIILPLLGVVLSLILIFSYNSSTLRQAVTAFSFDAARPSMSGVRIPGQSADGTEFFVQAGRIEMQSENTMSLDMMSVAVGKDPEIVVQSPFGRLNKRDQSLVLESPVELRQGPDWRLVLGVSNVRLDTRVIQSSDGVRAEGPWGLFMQADSMTSDMAAREHHFSGRVHVHIPPAQTRRSRTPVKNAIDRDLPKQPDQPIKGPRP